MSGHLSHEMLSALADGELSAAEMAGVSAHLAECSRCTSDALAQTLLKGATARAGQRYVAPQGLQEKIARAAKDASARESSLGASGGGRRSFGAGVFGWVAAAVVVLAVAMGLLQHLERQRATESALVAEVCDQHVAAIANGAAPEVLSSDRHTVKPWFAGRIPFSFNLPDGLPSDMKLDGANLTYVAGQPMAQLLYSVGKHRVSVFVSQRRGAGGSVSSERAGVHVRETSSSELMFVGVSDVEASRLTELIGLLQRAQE